ERGTEIGRSRPERAAATNINTPSPATRRKSHRVLRDLERINQSNFNMQALDGRSGAPSASNSRRKNDARIPPSWQPVLQSFQHMAALCIRRAMVAIVKQDDVAVLHFCEPSADICAGLLF